MRIYMVRHGETLLNQKKCYYGWTDAVLSARGIGQAQALGAYFREMPEIRSFDYVMASPLVRAYDTARLILGSEEARIGTDVRLMEQNFGLFEGNTYAELAEKYPEELAAWNQDFSHYVIPGGESFALVRARVEDFVRDIPREDKTMLLVAHKGTLGHMLAAMLGLPLEGYWNFVFEQGCYSLVDLEDGYAIIRKLNQSAGSRGEKNGFI